MDKKAINRISTVHKLLNKAFVELAVFTIFKNENIALQADSASKTLGEVIDTVKYIKELLEEK